MTSREIVRKCLSFDHPPRMPRHMWLLPWAQNRYGQEIHVIQQEFPDDITYAPEINDLCCVKGDPYTRGEYTDEWGCVFRNLQDGIIGEVHEPVIPDIARAESFTPPYHVLPDDENKAIEKVNHFCASTDKFVLTACFPRPWERYQFLRGTENAMLDYMVAEKEFKVLLKKIHHFYLKEFELWCKTDVDGLFFMDDWGSQQSLLIDPAIWRYYMKPLYRDYSDLAHSAGKYIFMHSDGNIQSILQDLIGIGVDAINSQLFVMDLETVAAMSRGKITFWGEIDRQHVMGAADPQVVSEAVQRVAGHLYDPSGGIIAQFELGPGARPENARLVFEQWDLIQKRKLL